jgi:hypothetical protein
MPKRPRYHDELSKELRDKLATIYSRLHEVSYMNKQEFEKWQERFCYSPEPEREVAVWEWLTKEYEKRTSTGQDQQEKNRVFRKLLRESVDYEPLGVRKLPE